MQQFSNTPKAILFSLCKHRQLIISLVRREVIGRYRGSVLGLLWSFLNPVFMLTVYTFVFSVVFKARWAAGGESKAEFALALFAGLIVFNLFSECINKAPGLIITNANYVKKVVFPLEILPWVVFGAALFHFFVSLSVWLVFSFFVIGLPYGTVVLFPLVVIPLVFLVMGLSWFLSSLGVFLRDVAQLVRIITTTLMFLTPIFYPVSAVPEKYRALIYCNPLALIVEQVGQRYAGPVDAVTNGRGSGDRAIVDRHAIAVGGDQVRGDAPGLWAVAGTRPVTTHEYQVVSPELDQVLLRLKRVRRQPQSARGLALTNEDARPAYLDVVIHDRQHGAGDPPNMGLQLERR